MWVAEQQSEKDFSDDSASDGTQPGRLNRLILNNRKLGRFHVQHGFSKNIRPERTLAFELSPGDIGDGFRRKSAFEALSHEDVFVVENRLPHCPSDILPRRQPQSPGA